MINFQSVYLGFESLISELSQFLPTDADSIINWYEQVDNATYSEVEYVTAQFVHSNS